MPLESTPVWNIAVARLWLWQLGRPIWGVQNQIQRMRRGTYLVVYWLRLHRPTAKDRGSIPGLRTEILHAGGFGRKKKKKEWKESNLNQGRVGGGGISVWKECSSRWNTTRAKGLGEGDDVPGAESQLIMLFRGKLSSITFAVLTELQSFHLEKRWELQFWSICPSIL